LDPKVRRKNLIRVTILISTIGDRARACNNSEIVNHFLLNKLPNFGPR
jgi:hypothetical protein